MWAITLSNTKTFGLRQKRGGQNYVESIICNSIKLLIESNVITFGDFIEDITIPMDALTAICVLPESFLRTYLEPIRYPPHLRLVK